MLNLNTLKQRDLTFLWNTPPSGAEHTAFRSAGSTLTE